MHFCAANLELDFDLWAWPSRAAYSSLVLPVLLILFPFLSQKQYGHYFLPIPNFLFWQAALDSLMRSFCSFQKASLKLLRKAFRFLKQKFHFDRFGEIAPKVICSEIFKTFQKTTYCRHSHNASRIGQSNRITFFNSLWIIGNWSIVLIGYFELMHAKRESH